MASQPFSRSELLAQLRAIGVQEGSVLQVHCAFSKVAPVEGGPEALIRALIEALGPSGTLVMPSMTSDDERPFDPGTTHCKEMGIVPDMFWRMAGVARSDSPHSFAAFGPHAAGVLAPHAVEVPHGPASPVGRVVDLDGIILLIGVGHDANTTVHLAENMENVQYHVPKYSIALRNGRPIRIDYTEPSSCCARFSRIDAVLDGLAAQRRGFVGNAPARLVRARSVVDAARHLLARDPRAFLHPQGACAECDAGWAGLHARDRRGSWGRFGV
jgi:aminoglycoside N3'-acetyltransferase